MTIKECLEELVYVLSTGDFGPRFDDAIEFAARFIEQSYANKDEDNGLV